MALTQLRGGAIYGRRYGSFIGRVPTITGGQITIPIARKLTTRLDTVETISTRMSVSSPVGIVDTLASTGKKRETDTLVTVTKTKSNRVVTL